MRAKTADQSRSRNRRGLPDRKRIQSSVNTMRASLSDAKEVHAGPETTFLWGACMKFKVTTTHHKQALHAPRGEPRLSSHKLDHNSCLFGLNLERQRQAITKNSSCRSASVSSHFILQYTSKPTMTTNLALQSKTHLIHSTVRRSLRRNIEKRLSPHRNHRSTCHNRTSVSPWHGTMHRAMTQTPSPIQQSE